MDDSWWLTWSPEEGEDVRYTLAPWSEMSYGELAVFQHEFSTSLKERLDSPGAIPVSDCAHIWGAADGAERTVERGSDLGGSPGRD